MCRVLVVIYLECCVGIVGGLVERDGGKPVQRRGALLGSAAVGFGGGGRVWGEGCREGAWLQATLGWGSHVFYQIFYRFYTGIKGYISGFLNIELLFSFINFQYARF